MGADFSLLLAPFAPSGAVSDAVVERLEAVERAAEKEDYALARDLAAELGRDGIHDIRPISYWLFQEFREEGFEGIAKSLEALENVLGPSLAALGPERRKEEYVTRRLVWLFDKISAAVEYHEKYATAQWDSLKRTLVPETLARIAAAGERVTVLLAAQAEAMRALSQLLSRARSYRLEAPKPPEPTAESKSASVVPASPADPTTTAAAVPAIPTPFPAKEGLSRVELLVAYPFVELCRRLKAFESLVEKHELRKAAVVAEDIAYAVEHFDPLANFPELFARHAALLCKHAARLSEFDAERQSATWLALARYARVDLDAFVEG
ncbi:MAG TPA: type VI secretion system protein IglI family protein [Polyangiaceae bacterium]|nr:type VI secretion system protein IglI family protein [Polyangiaceae bacterium]